MTRVLRPLLRGSTYTGALFAFGGALASLPLLLAATVPALLWQSAPQGLRIALVLPLWAALIGAAGLAGGTRRVLVVGARRLLGVPLPDPAPRRPRPANPYGAGPYGYGAPGYGPPGYGTPGHGVPGHGPTGDGLYGYGYGTGPATGSYRPGPVGADRLRTPAYLVLHVALGWTGMLLAGVLTAAGVALPGNWLGAEARITLFGRTARMSGGWQSWPAALGCLLLAAAVCVAVAGALRLLAPRLLGPSTAERLALAAERETRLAERNRLAHELHDSIGHTLTATTIQAAVADEVLAADPVAARAALRSIEESSRSALEDLDYVLGVLREETVRTAPTRTLADLPELLERLRHAGAVVEPELSGDPAQVHGTLSRAAYRILQEGLTNALRHGAGGPIAVRVAAAPDVLELSVVNRTGVRTGPGAGGSRGAGGSAGAGGSPGRDGGTGLGGQEGAGCGAGTRAFPTSGHGLPGLAERVRLLHGGIEAGPDGPEHWRLAVRLPVRLPA